MILTAVLIGAVCGIVTAFVLFRSGMLRERSGAAMLLAAIAAFYPVFAMIEADPLAIVLHLAIFVGFTALALRGFRDGHYLIAGGLIAHGIFDVGLMLSQITGPAWWPPFCASFDIISGASILRLIQTGKAPR